MRFALLGDHPDGLDMARALVESGRHELAVYSGSPGGIEALKHRGLGARPVGDLEEVLADPALEAVLVAGGLSVRAAQLRRALQSERHVVCVHPVDQTPDAAYEAAMIQTDVRRALLPILPEALHPAISRLTQMIQAPNGPLGTLQLVTMDRWVPKAWQTEAHMDEPKATFPGWDVLRALRGELAEVSAFAAGDEASAAEPLLLSGRFENGGLFQATWLPGRSAARWWLAVIGTQGQAELVFPQGWPGPARLSCREGGALREETWEAWNPGPALVKVFELGVAEAEQAPPLDTTRKMKAASWHPSWQDAVRCLELDDAARRSVARRRASTLEYQEITEEVGFKGTMTLAGCALVWGIILLVILSHWFPWLGWGILPLLSVFLVMQLLRWLVPRAGERGKGE
jgi:predicted dehydrogenase